MQMGLLILAVAPAVFLLLFIRFMDRNEPEPLGFLLKVFFLGGLSIIPAIILGLSLGALPPLWFFYQAFPPPLSHFWEQFITVALVEEGVKLGVVLLFVWNSPHFNEENDGIVYVATSALGFALFENILYVSQHGMEVGIIRAFTAVPGHCFWGVIMGWFVGKARFQNDPARRQQMILGAYLAVAFLHAWYNALLVDGGNLYFVSFLIILVGTLTGLVLMAAGRRASLLRSQLPLEAPVLATNLAPVSAPIGSLPNDARGQTASVINQTVSVSAEATRDRQRLQKVLSWALISVALFTLGMILWAFLVDREPLASDKTGLEAVPLQAPLISDIPDKPMDGEKVGDGSAGDGRTETGNAKEPDRP